MKKSNLAIVAISLFRGENATTDKNGESPVYLQPIAGAIPNRNVMSGTVAADRGFIPGNSYAVKWTRNEDQEDEDGETYVNINFTNLGKVDLLQIAEFEEKYGTGSLLDAEKCPVTKLVTPSTPKEESVQAG